MAITVAGRVFSWGNGQQGQLGRVGERIPENRRLSAFLTPAEILVLKRPSKGLRVVDVQCKSFSTFVSLSGELSVTELVINLLTRRTPGLLAC